MNMPRSRVIGVRHLAQAVFVLVVILLLQLIPMERLVAMLSAPAFAPLERESEAVEEEAALKAKDNDASPVPVHVRAQLPQNPVEAEVPMGAEQPSTVPAFVEDLNNQMEEITKEVLAEEPEMPVTEGEQEGFDVPSLALTQLSAPLVRSLLSSEQLMLRLSTYSGTSHWFVPHPGADPGASNSEYYRAGELVRDPESVGLRVSGPDGALLRESPFNINSSFVPMASVLADMARSKGIVPLPAEGALRVSPDLEAEMVSAQMAALAELGLSSHAVDWPAGLKMYGCWDASQTFIVTLVKADLGLLLEVDQCDS